MSVKGGFVNQTIHITFMMMQFKSVRSLRADSMRTHNNYSYPFFQVLSFPDALTVYSSHFAL